MTLEIPKENIRISHRAGQGTNLDELYLIPSCMAGEAEFMVNPTTKFVRLNPTAIQRPVYRFAENWERPDGEPCEEEPGMIYAMGHCVQVLPGGEV